jgi:hypothetical protein
VLALIPEMRCDQDLDEALTVTGLLPGGFMAMPSRSLLRAP